MKSKKESAHLSRQEVVDAPNHPRGFPLDLIKRKGTDYNMPTQRSVEMGLFRIKETVVSHSDGHTSINKTPKITGKGQTYFVNLFLSQKKQ